MNRIDFLLMLNFKFQPEERRSLPVTSGADGVPIVKREPSLHELFGEFELFDFGRRERGGVLGGMSFGLILIKILALVLVIRAVCRYKTSVAP